jgi:glycosyltransferase involved in cell wall biosynthesis
MRGLSGLGVERALMSPNGVDVAEVEAAGKSQCQWDLVYVGRLVAHKGLATLIDALSVLGRRGLFPRVAMVGEGPAEGTLQLQAQDAKLFNIDFLGRLESDGEVYSTMAAARMFVLPSEREGFGLAALEACAAGVPIVTVDAPLNAVAEFVDNARVGVVCGRSPEALASAISRLLDDDALRGELADRAKRTALEYDWSATATALHGEFESIVGSDSTPEPMATQNL